MSLLRLHITLLLLVTGLVFGVASAQDITIDKENSRLWIEGTSNVNRFQCRAARYNTDVDPPTTDTTAKVKIDVDVKGFDCGKRRMNRDLYETLLAGKHPFISFEYDSTESMTYSEETDTYNMSVAGKLTVAGHTNRIQFPLTAVLKDENTIRAVGSTILKMTAYNVDPPSALLGLVRVNDELVVHFEIIANLNNLELPRNGQNQE